MNHDEARDYVLAQRRYLIPNKQQTVILTKESLKMKHSNTVESLLSDLSTLDPDARANLLANLDDGNCLALLGALSAEKEWQRSNGRPLAKYPAILTAWREELQIKQDAEALHRDRVAAVLDLTRDLFAERAKPTRVFLSATANAPDDVVLLHPFPRGVILGVLNNIEYVSGERSVLTFIPRKLWDNGLSEVVMSEYARCKATLRPGIGELLPFIVREEMSVAISLDDLAELLPGFHVVSKSWLKDVRCLKALALWIFAAGENSQTGQLVAERFREFDRTGTADFITLATWWTEGEMDREEMAKLGTKLANRPSNTQAAE